MTRVALTMFIMLIAMSSAAEEGGEKDATPRGMVAFFTTSGCPVGWTVMTNAGGRLLVGTTTASEVNVAIGTPLQPATPPSHAHSFTMRIAVPFHGAAAAMGCCNNTVAPSGTFDAGSGNTKSETGDLPYLQLTVCRKS